MKSVSNVPLKVKIRLECTNNPTSTVLQYSGNINSPSVLAYIVMELPHVMLSTPMIYVPSLG